MPNLSDLINAAGQAAGTAAKVVSLPLNVVAAAFFANTNDVPTSRETEMLRLLRIKPDNKSFFGSGLDSEEIFKAVSDHLGKLVKDKEGADTKRAQNAAQTAIDSFIDNPSDAGLEKILEKDNNYTSMSPNEKKIAKDKLKGTIKELGQIAKASVGNLPGMKRAIDKCNEPTMVLICELFGVRIMNHLAKKGRENADKATRELVDGKAAPPNPALRVAPADSTGGKAAPSNPALRVAPADSIRASNANTHSSSLSASARASASASASASAK